MSIGGGGGGAKAILCVGCFLQDLNSLTISIVNLPVISNQFDKSHFFLS